MCIACSRSGFSNSVSWWKSWTLGRGTFVERNQPSFAHKALQKHKAELAEATNYGALSKPSMKISSLSSSHWLGTGSPEPIISSISSR